MVMGMREKMIELLMQKGFGVEGATIAADNLIENGATIPVRCKDCNHLEITGCYGECRKLVRIVKPWDFCSYGERKDND
jgi:hypothetical protein